MRTLTLMIVAVIFLFIQSCKGPAPIKNTLELSDEMMSYFVNYEIGTKWTYQDTMNKNNIEVIELVSKKSRDVNTGDGTLSRGFELYYKPQTSKAFKVIVSAGANNTYFANVDPGVLAGGTTHYENDNGIWTTGVSYFDSLEISGNKYYNVIESNSGSSCHFLMKVSKSVGIIFFWQIEGGAIFAAYKLIKTEVP